MVLEAETKESAEERIQMLKEADGKIRTALYAIYADIETTSKSFARRTSLPFWHLGNQVNTFMGYLTSDLQIATKYIGVRMQLLEYIVKPKQDKEKTCIVCGRITTDKNNKTGLCPKHQKQGNNILGIGGLAAFGIGLKKFGPKIVKGAI